MQGNNDWELPGGLTEGLDYDSPDEAKPDSPERESAPSLAQDLATLLDVTRHYDGGPELDAVRLRLEVSLKDRP